MAALHRPALAPPRLLWRPRPRRLVLVAAVGLTIIVALVQVNQFSKSTSASYEINELNRLRAAREAQNHQLESEVAQFASLARVDIEARVKLGMVPASRTMWIAVNHPPPAEETLPSRLQPPAEEVLPAEDEAWWVSVAKLLTPF